MKVLIAYPFPSVSNNFGDKLWKYIPNLDEDGLQAEIATYKPDSVIVGNNVVNAETLQKWRTAMGSLATLSIIRRSSSKSDIDIKKADSLNINHYRTLSVNAPTLSAVIGCGATGRRVIERLIREGHTVKVYSPSLANCSCEEEQENVAKSKGLAHHERIYFASSLEEAVKNVNYIAIAIDATQVVATGELSILFDSHYRDVKHLLDRIPPDNKTFEVRSNAMYNFGCQQAIDQAALIVLASIIVEQTIDTRINFRQVPGPQEHIIIVGLVSALLLSQRGYRVTIVDSHEKPLVGRLISDNFRHATTTESITHHIQLCHSPQVHLGTEPGIPDRLILAEKVLF
ncbi:unnamed protein product [Didymodactylos carnosus]|uniref:Uncharacterized protein n=1 Tax=Didymodactylos carnosus TaxID=1234261 RepID=A0A815P3Z0_9BILA|nr:unnamed protein product [Didymodactylos carnosus]CAF1443822.1 unnamed protein product [Didymodactylos carnosus]CAF4192904.1 unnamed protein product [Didymodactylos carnosus]CAF4319110.1 unnamed protein product [Didymodactylos carnosus]